MGITPDVLTEGVTGGRLGFASDAPEAEGGGGVGDTTAHPCGVAGTDTHPQSRPPGHSSSAHSRQKATAPTPTRLSRHEGAQLSNERSELAHAEGAGGGGTRGPSGSTLSSDTEPPEGLGTGHPGTQRVPCPNYSGVRTHHLPLKNGLAPHASHAGKAERHPPGPPRPTKEHTPSSARHLKTRMRTCGGQVAAPPHPEGRTSQAGRACSRCGTQRVALGTRGRARQRRGEPARAAGAEAACACVRSARAGRAVRRRLRVKASACQQLLGLASESDALSLVWGHAPSNYRPCVVTGRRVSCLLRAGVGGGSSASPEAWSCPVGEPRATGRSRTETAADAVWAEGGAGAPRAYLQHAAHPLEAVLLGGVRPLLRHQHHPVVMQHRHREHGDPEHEGERDRAAKGALSPARPARQGLPAEDVQSHRPPVPSAAAETH